VGADVHRGRRGSGPWWRTDLADPRAHAGPGAGAAVGGRGRAPDGRPDRRGVRPGAGAARRQDGARRGAPADVSMESVAGRCPAPMTASRHRTPTVLLLAAALASTACGAPDGTAGEGPGTLTITDSAGVQIVHTRLPAPG